MDIFREYLSAMKPDRNAPRTAPNSSKAVMTLRPFQLSFLRLAIAQTLCSDWRLMLPRHLFRETDAETGAS